MAAGRRAGQREQCPGSRRGGGERSVGVNVERIHYGGRHECGQGVAHWHDQQRVHHHAERRRGECRVRHQGKFHDEPSGDADDRTCVVRSNRRDRCNRTVGSQRNYWRNGADGCGDNRSDWRNGPGGSYRTSRSHRRYRRGDDRRYRRDRGERNERLDWSNRRHGGERNERRDWSDRRHGSERNERLDWSNRRHGGERNERLDWCNRRQRYQRRDRTGRSNGREWTNGSNGSNGATGATGPAGTGTITLQTVRSIPSSAGFSAGETYTGFEQGLNSSALTSPGCGTAVSAACAYSVIPPSCSTISNLQVHTIGNIGQTISWGIVTGAPGSIPGTTAGLSCSTQTNTSTFSCNSGASTLSTTGGGTLSLQFNLSGAQATALAFYATVDCH